VADVAARLGRSITAGATRAGSATSVRWFLVLAWGLTFHNVAVMAIFASSGLSINAVRAVAAWKEVTALALLVATAGRLASGRAPELTVRTADLLALGLVAVTGLQVLAALAGWGPSADGVDIAYASRDLVFGFLLYFVGRATPELGDRGTVQGSLFVIGAITSVIAVLEWAFITPQWLAALGVTGYFSDFLGVSSMIADNGTGLPNNYWTQIGGHYVQRAGSVFLSSQGLAVSFLLTMPAAVTWLLLKRRWQSLPFAIAFGLLCAALLLTVTRMSIVACTLQVLLLLLLWRRPGTVLSLGAFAAVTAAVLLAVVPNLAGFVWDTLTWQTGSSATHANDYYNGLVAMVHHPLGAGLGTADLTAARLGREPITGDNLYLKYGVELGLPGLVLFVAWLATLLWTCIRSAFVAASRSQRAFFAFAAACVLGVMVNGATAVVFNAPLITYLFFWVAGTAVARLPVDAEHGNA
jgi:hypothetical protein